MAEAGTILIAVKDSVLADCLRFSLELEGYEARLCEPPLEQLADVELRTCLLLDQEVFATLYAKAGLSLNTREFDLRGRPQYLVDPGIEPMRELM